jgi:hypothetical protein
MMPEVVAQFLTRRDQDCIDDVDDAVRGLNVCHNYLGVVDADLSSLEGDRHRGSL